MAGLRMDKDGNVGIGTANCFGYKLAVNGTVSFKEIEMKPTTAWPDYVFDSVYQTKPLKLLEEEIMKNKHLPGIPSAKEAEENGIKQTEFNAALLKNMEEMYLYIFELQKEITELKTKLNEQ